MSVHFSIALYITLWHLIMITRWLNLFISLSPRDIFLTHLRLRSFRARQIHWQHFVKRVSSIVSLSSLMRSSSLLSRNTRKSRSSRIFSTRKKKPRARALIFFTLERAEIRVDREKVAPAMKKPFPGRGASEKWIQLNSHTRRAKLNGGAEKKNVSPCTRTTKREKLGGVQTRDKPNVFIHDPFCKRSSTSRKFRLGVSLRKRFSRTGWETRGTRVDSRVRDGGEGKKEEESEPSLAGNNLAREGALVGKKASGCK